MNDTEAIFCIYGFYDNKDVSSSAYFITYAYNSKGILDQELIEKVYSQISKSEIEWRGEGFGPFESLDILNKFSYNLTQELSAAGVAILSIEDYNSCLDEASELGQLKANVFRVANKIENPDFKASKGIFSNIFN